MNEINNIKYYFSSEIQERKSIIKKLSKYIAALSAAIGGVSNISCESVIDAPAAIENACFTLVFTLTTGMIKKALRITKNKSRKHNKILALS